MFSIVMVQIVVYSDDKAIRTPSISRKGVHGLGIKLNKSLKDSTFIHEFEDESKEKNILLSSNKGLKERALEVFDQTFKITWMLAVISGIIATLSLINYVSITLIDREKELTQLRSIGAKHSFFKSLYYFKLVGLRSRAL